MIPGPAGRGLSSRRRSRSIRVLAAGRPCVLPETLVADNDFDLFVIGAGSAGVRAARMSAGFGARVAIAEMYRPGGTCVIRGCIPKKLLVYAAHYREDFEDARAYGWSAQPEFSWPTLIANKNREIAQLEDVYRTLLKTSGVRLLEGRARFIDAHTIDIAGQRYRARHILIATGGWPTMPADPGNRALHQLERGAGARRVAAPRPHRRRRIRRGGVHRDLPRARLGRDARVPRRADPPRLRRGRPAASAPGARPQGRRPAARPAT